MKDKKQCHRAEREQDNGHESEASQEKLKALPKTDATSQCHSKHTVDHAVDQQSGQNDQWKLDGNIRGHGPPLPHAHGESIGATAQDDGRDTEAQ